MSAAVVTHGDAAPVFDFGEHVLDFMTLFVELLIVTDTASAVFAGWNARSNAFNS